METLMQINQAGRDLIRRFEGERLERYDDGVGNDTIGVGHKITPDDDIGDTITQEQSNQLFEKDLTNAASQVARLITVPVTDNQFAALVSFCFNLGAATLARSTLLKKLNDGDMQGAADEFPRWVYAGPEESDGLIARREAEKELFLTSN